ncbi:MAG: alpha/beta hydrolase [Polyangiaceae bacterium]
MTHPHLSPFDDLTRLAPPPDALLAHVLSGRQEGELVVFLPSSGMSSRQWKKLAEDLGNTHRTLAVDLSGTGANPPWPADAPFHFHDDVAAVARLVDSVAGPATRFHVVGHSYGGLVGLTLARVLPSRILSIAAFEPVAMGILHDANDTEGLAELARVERNRAFFDATTGGTEPWMKAFVEYWNGEGAWDWLPDPAKASMLAVGRKVFLEVTSLLRDRTGLAAYRAIEAPASFLTGAVSPRAAGRVVELAAAGFVKGSSHRFEGVGHMAPVTNAALVNPVIAAHVRAASG